MWMKRYVGKLEKYEWYVWNIEYVLGCKNSAKVEHLEKGSKDVGKSFFKY